MAKLESTLKNMVLSLTLISMGMSGALAVVYLKTKEPIAAAEKMKTESAVKQVIPAFDSIQVARVGIDTGDTLVLSYGFKDDTLVGIAVQTDTNKGFSGRVAFVVGMLPDGTIHHVGGFEMKETPGLGTKMKDPKFLNQFFGKNPSTYILKVKKDGGKVDAITAATISSRAFCDATQKAYDAVMKGGKQ
jgi:Na+-translocating ferredoxin:NAD+ oxidoreductase subunit G